MKKLEKEIIKELLKKCDFKERIIVRLHSKTFLKMYHIARINIVNYFLEQ